MNVLLIGGSRFVGRHIVETLKAAGASVTLFNRGTNYGDPVEGVQFVHGDRTSDLHRLDPRTWDAVVDTSAYTLIDAEIAARYFAQRTGMYVFISTISVYDHERAAILDEDAPLAVLPESADRTRMVPETYGALKALCEAIVVSTFRNRALVLRPGLVAGPYDPTDRFTYWPVRIGDGGDVLLPGSPNVGIQYIDARDLANFTVHLILRQSGGTFNVVTTPQETTFGDVFEGCRRAARVDAVPLYVDERTLADAGVEPWRDLPLWIPSFSPLAAIARASNERAQRAGLQLRPAAQTCADVLRWARSAGKRRETLSAGISAAREAALLAASRASAGLGALR